MGNWQDIWRTDGSSRIWSSPDPAVVAVVDRWHDRDDVRRVLDLGCGIGRHAHLVARQGFEIFGIDHSAAAIEQCRRRLEEDDLRGHFLCGDLGEIPYPDGYFDAVLAFNSIYHGTAASLGRVVDTIARKTRIGGTCFATLPSRENRMYGRGEEIEPHTFLSPGMFDGLFEQDGEKGEPHHFASEDEIRYLFRDFTIDSLVQEEVRLAFPGRDGVEVRWKRIPKTYFWRLMGTRRDDA